MGSQPRKSLLRHLPSFLAASLLLASTAAAQTEKALYRLGVILGDQKDRSFDSDVLNASIVAFVDSKRFTIVERSQLDSVLTEKDLQEFLGGQVNQKLSEVLGLDYLGVVSYTYDRAQANSLTPTPKLIIDARLIDVRTATVFATISSDRPEIVPPATPRDAGGALFRSIREAFAPLGYVVKVDGKKIIVDLGSEAGINEGDVLEVVREGEPIIHPVTGVLIPAEMEVVGELKVQSASLQTATCKPKSGTTTVALASIVRLKKERSAWKEWVSRIPYARVIAGGS